jgi:hypothetical protein
MGRSRYFPHQKAHERDIPDGKFCYMQVSDLGLFEQRILPCRLVGKEGEGLRDHRPGSDYLSPQALCGLNTALVVLVSGV